MEGLHVLTHKSDMNPVKVMTLYPMYVLYGLFAVELQAFFSDHAPAEAGPLRACIEESAIFMNWKFERWRGRL